MYPNNGHWNALRYEPLRRLVAFAIFIAVLGWAIIEGLLFVVRHLA